MVVSIDEYGDDKIHIGQDFKKLEVEFRQLSDTVAKYFSEIAFQVENGLPDAKTEQGEDEAPLVPVLKSSVKAEANMWKCNLC